MTPAYQILLYYFYTEIADPEGYLQEHLALCKRLGLRGRILVAGEGLNGTVSGTREQTEDYMRVLQDDPQTAGISFKIDETSGHAFPRLSVKLCSEVVTLGLGENDFSPNEITGQHLKPAEWRAMMKQEDVVMIDARNDYEWELGRFEGALLPEVESFRELPAWVRRHRDELEGKKILTYCTGGIRCEKFSGFLKREGFEKVYQLDGGIVTYGKDPEVRGEGFEGKCYVFDERIRVEVNRADGVQVVSRCLHCGQTSDRYVNCAWTRCNAQHFCCETCESRSGRYCDRACEEAAVVSLAAKSIEGD